MYGHRTGMGGTKYSRHIAKEDRMPGFILEQIVKRIWDTYYEGTEYEAGTNASAVMAALRLDSWNADGRSS